MRRATARAVGAALAALATGLVTASAVPAGAQAPLAPGTGAAADVPAGPAAIRGRVVHPSVPEAAAGLPVVLYALPADGVPGLRGVETDARGEFAFEGIAAAPDTAYLVGVRYNDIPFGARVTFAPGELERSVELEVLETKTDTAGLAVGEVRIRVEPSCDDLQLAQVVELRNASDEVIYVPEAERASREPLVELVLPETSRGFEIPFGSFSQGLERVDTRVRFWGPLYPGSQRIEFGFALEVTAGRAAGTLGFPTGAERVLVLSHEAAPAPRGEGLAPALPIEFEGRRYLAWSAGAVAAGDALALELDLPAATGAAAGGPDALGLAQTRIWLELDDAALSVDERYELEVRGGEALVAGALPLLCIPLPEGAEELRFGGATLSMGLSRDPSGALAVRGPLPPGPSAISLRYLLPAERGRVSLARRFGLDLPLLTVFVADTGVAAESQVLHRRRPFRANDRSYMHLEAFEIAAGQPVDLQLAALAAPSSPSRGATALIVSVLALGAIAFLAAPLRTRAREEDSDVVGEATWEREAVYGQLRDLEHDYETGKLDEDDYQRTRRELRARAVTLLRREREGAEATAAAAPEAAGPAGCPACGATPPADARFCPQCGLELASPGGPVRSQGAA